MATRLKSLELHGYKTFASRTIFEFPEQITAIVGPNGSGKSNIADAIRWVLGEQSYSLLRGRKTEDMIFSGSEQRPRAGMASAAIIFDNADGWLPIDYSEVSLARRAYRDGNNEYLINNQRVRLKEISELLAQSGLAERTYTIIGQGLVDAALSLKPEERRRFFEEAAGIGLYRSRREDALNRLETTKRNLERVQDILVELEPRLATLERQARRAAEYERIKADLRVLLRDWYGYYWHHSNAELAHARETLKVQEARLEQARNRMEQVTTEVEALRARMQTARMSLNEWHTQSAEVHRQWEQVSRNLAVLEERQRALSNSQGGLTADLTRLSEEEQVQLNRLANLEAEQKRLQQELDDSNRQLAEAQQLMQIRQKERDRVDTLLREARRVLVSLETGQVQGKAHLSEVANRLDGLRRTLENYRNSLKTDEQAVAQAQTLVERAKTHREEAEEELHQFEEELVVQRRQLTSLENERRNLQDGRARLEADLSRAKAQLEVLEQAERSLSGMGQGARNLVQAARQGKLKAGIRALSTDLVVPQELETAIAAALSDLLDGLVIDPDNVELVLDFLANGDQGRANIVTRDARAHLIDAPQADPDCLGVASRLVKAPDEVQPILDVLLGMVLVVRNRAAARRLASTLPVGARAVTLQGEVYWSNGIISAGKENRGAVVARPRQRLDLQEAVQNSQANLTESLTQIQCVDGALQHSREMAQKLEQETRNVSSRVNQLNQEVQQATLNLEKLRQKIEWQRGQIAEVEKQIRAAEEDRKRTQEQIDSAGARIQQANDQVRDHNRTLGGLPLEELQSQVTHWNTSVAVTGRATHEISARVKDARLDTEANRLQQQTLRERISANSNALGQAEREKSELLQQQARLDAEIAALRVKIEPAEAELYALEQEYSRLQANQAAAQQALGVADRYAVQAQTELSHQRDALDNLRRRIEDDFGLVAFEYSEQVEGQTTLPFDGMVEQLPQIHELPADLEENINRQRAQLRRMGQISPESLAEYREVKERRDFMVSQVEDLKKADADLRQVIAELDELMKREFRKTFTAVAAEFRQMFTRLFNGGSATLELVDEENLAEAGIEIEARLPGRREQGLSLLSGGERSLTAAALVFSLLKVSPTPFCVLDEVDAMLDEANVGRYRDLLRELSEKTQFIVITHNRNTVQAADVIYGVTMGRDSASQVISLKLDEISDDMVR